MEVYRRALPEPSIGKLYSSLVLYVLYTVRLCTYAYSYKSKMLLVIFSLILSHRQLIVCTVKYCSVMCLIIHLLQFNTAIPVVTCPSNQGRSTGYCSLSLLYAQTYP